MTPARALAAGVTVAFALGAGGCAERIAAPPPAPAMDRPGDAIPGDLDLALRLDLVAARRLLGAGAIQSLQIDLADKDEDPGTIFLIDDALAHADVAWVAFRPGHAARFTDNVLLFRGKFAAFDPRIAPKSDWGSVTDLGGAFRLYERKPPRRRSAPTRIYARGDDWLVFVSVAEIDSTERSLERRAMDPHVDPVDKGLISLSARVPALIPLLKPDYPAVSEALEGATKLDANAAADDRGLMAMTEVRFADDIAAGVAKDRIALLLKVLSQAKGPFAMLARASSASALGASLVVRTNVDAPGLSQLIECLTAGKC